MIKSILTITILAGLQLVSFAQQDAATMIYNENVELVSKTVAEKSDITGSIANVGGWNIFIDDAKVEINEKAVKQFSDKDMQSLLQTGFKFAKKNKSKNACYKYRIATNVDGTQDMFLYECGF